MPPIDPKELILFQRTEIAYLKGKITRQQNEIERLKVGLRDFGGICTCPPSDSVCPRYSRCAYLASLIG